MFLYYISIVPYLHVHTITQCIAYVLFYLLSITTTDKYIYYRCLHINKLFLKWESCVTDFLVFNCEEETFGHGSCRPLSRDFVVTCQNALQETFDILWLKQWRGCYKNVKNLSCEQGAFFNGDRGFFCTKVCSYICRMPVLVTGL